MSRFVTFFSQTINPPAITPVLDSQEFNILGQMVEEPFSNITVDAEACNVNLVSSSDGICQVEYKQLNLDSVSGSITVPEDFSFSQAQVSTTSGKLQFYASVSGNLSLESVSGTMEVSNVTPQSLSLSSTSGPIHASQVAVMETWDINSVSGQVTLTDCDASSLVISTVSGGVKASLRSGKTFSTQTVSGDVQVPSDSSGGTCNISTVSGDITCTIQ